MYMWEGIIYIVNHNVGFDIGEGLYSVDFNPVHLQWNQF